MIVVALVAAFVDLHRRPAPGPTKRMQPVVAAPQPPRVRVSQPRAATGQSQATDRRGREADKPSQIPSKGWKDVFFRVKREVSEDNVSIVAAGVAFYGLMALAPAIAALVSIYSLFVSPADIQSHFQGLTGLMPEQARQLLLDQVERIASAPSSGLTFAAVGSLLLTLLSAMKGSKALITAANIAYDEEEKRGFIKLNIAAFSLTVGSILFVLVALGLIAGFPVVVDYLPLPESIRVLLSLLRWPFLAVLLVLGLALFYRYAPHRSTAKWRWVTWGSVFSTVFWIVGSVLFSVYVAKFASYNESYGSLGAVVVLLMWFFVSAFVVILGAEINAEMEHQTARDSTTGTASPIGERGAYVADTVGEAKPG